MSLEITRILGNIFKYIITFTPWIIGLIGAHQWAYTKSPKYYFFLMKRLSKRKDTNWNVTCMYVAKKDQEDFFAVLQSIIKEQFGTYSRKFNLKNKKHYEFGAFAVTVLYDIEESKGEFINIELDFSNMNVTVENAEERLRELRVLLNNLEKRVGFNRKQYNVNIIYTSMKNPFYGLMIQRLGEEHVEYFECVFPLSLLRQKEKETKINNNYKLRVFKGYITITETNFDKIEEISKYALLLR